MKPSRDISGLLEIMTALRTPHTGCPWDLEQNFATIAPYTIEEAYEVADAIARGDLADLRDELGDLLLQVVFHARMAQEQGALAIGDVVQAITEKIHRPHPHQICDAQSPRPKSRRAKSVSRQRACARGPGCRRTGGWRLVVRRRQPRPSPRPGCRGSPPQHQPKIRTPVWRG